jgi:hypothetical protein
MPNKNPEERTEAVRRQRQREKVFSDVMVRHWNASSLQNWCELSKKGEKLLCGLAKVGNHEEPLMIVLPYGKEFLVNALKSNNFPLEVKFLENYFVIENVGNEEPRNLITDIHEKYEKIKDKEFTPQQVQSSMDLANKLINSHPLGRG